MAVEIRQVVEAGKQADLDDRTGALFEQTAGNVYPELVEIIDKALAGILFKVPAKCILAQVGYASRLLQADRAVEIVRYVLEDRIEPVVQQGAG